MLSIFLGAFFIIIIIGYIYLAFFLPLPQLLTHPANQVSTKIFDRHGELLYEVVNPDYGRQTYLKLEQFPEIFLQATLVSEDANFYQHPGVDLAALARAIFFNALERRITSGASTITQQLVRNMLGVERDRGFSEKLLEAAYAIRINNYYSKDQILELYLNTIYYGNQSYGAQTAALNYFGKNLIDLDEAELTLLAGLPQSPSNYNPLVNFDLAKKRQQYVLNQLIKKNNLTEDRAKSIFDQSLKFNHDSAAFKAPHFVRYVIGQLEEAYGPDQVNYGGLQVTTTLDYNLQLSAQQIIDRRLEELSTQNVTNAAALAAAPNGQILVWIGSSNYFNTEIDGQVDIIRALRQPGSALKPFLYLQALEKNYTAASILPDLPYTFQTDSGPYSPKNYDLDYRGPVRIRRALANSLNIPAVRMLEKIGLNNFLNFLRGFGLESLNQPADHYGLALTLGGGEVRFYELFRAYLALSNSGNLIDPSVILKVTQSTSAQTSEQPSLLYSWEPPVSHNLLGAQGKQNSYIITNILSDANARLESFGEGNILELPFPAAVKTGTTRNFRDNWTFGYSPQRIVGVWVGNADATAMENLSGVDGAGPIWHDLMIEAHRSLSTQEFPRPANLQDISICAISGLLPGENCSNQIQEIFLKGTEPTQFDNFYQPFACSNTNSTSIFINYPQEYQEWALERDLLPPVYCQPLNSDQSDVNSVDSSSPSPEHPAKILSPLNNDSFQISQNLPLESQKIPIKYSITPSSSQIQLFLDGKLIYSEMASQSPASPQFTQNAYFWLPEAGKHRLKAVISFTNQPDYATPEIAFEIN
ncbi:MAG: penicillin-binding protein 1C [Candidatus Altimarinota bacterium]